MLYLSCIIETALQWYGTKWQFVDNGDTRDSVFLAGLSFPQWCSLAIDISIYISFVISDGLLIWRCFHVWNCSLRVISVSLFLIVAEIALFLVQVAFDARYSDLTISATLAARLNAELAAAYFLSLSTTFLTTALIAYRIYSVSKQQGASSRRFKHIVDIVVQSGALYALSQLAAAMALALVYGSTVYNTRYIAFEEYTQASSFSIAGISSTIMVARVALLSEDTTYPSTSVHLSDLQFYAASVHPTVNIEAMDVAPSVEGDRGSGGQAVEDKVQ